MTDECVEPAVKASPINLEQPTDEEGATTATVRAMPVRRFRELGLVHEINRLILHPLGLAMSVNIDPADNEETFGPVWDCMDDPEGIYFGDDYLDGRKSEFVAKLIEERGRTRVPVLGYVVQPVDAKFRQLHLTIKEPTQHTIPGPGEYNEGEER